MKNILILKSQHYKLVSILIFIFSIVNSAYNQDIRPNETNGLNEEFIFKQNQLKNEVKINLAYVTFGIIEASYERLLPKNSSIGVVFGKSLIREYGLNFHSIVFYRLFFGEQSGSGFFIEANGAYWRDNTYYSSENFGSNGLGLAVGGKFFRGKSLHGEFVLGFGRSLTTSYYTDFEDFYPRFAISLGHRF
ncbi:MAG TPA: hypothetical protein PLZ32_09885 [Saprospiraceae bacterium]|nr:hypothetical protein [Saprospiraceae bacterium]